MNILHLTTPIRVIRTKAIILVATGVLSACALSTQPPDKELQAAEAAIANAERERVGEYAAPELNAAREKLTAARVAVRQQDMVLAAYLATESTA